MGWNKRQYAKDFRDQVLELVKNGRPVSQVAKELDMSRHVIYSWIRKEDEKVKKKEPVSPIEEENMRLRRELEDITMERDILKKVMAVFSKQPR